MSDQNELDRLRKEAIDGMQGDLERTVRSAILAGGCVLIIIGIAVSFLCWLVFGVFWAKKYVGWVAAVLIVVTSSLVSGIIIAIFLYLYIRFFSRRESKVMTERNEIENRSYAPLNQNDTRRLIRLLTSEFSEADKYNSIETKCVFLSFENSLQEKAKEIEDIFKKNSISVSRYDAENPWLITHAAIIDAITKSNVVVIVNCEDNLSKKIKRESLEEISAPQARYRYLTNSKSPYVKKEVDLASIFSKPIFVVRNVNDALKCIPEIQQFCKNQKAYRKQEFSFLFEAGLEGLDNLGWSIEQILDIEVTLEKFEHGSGEHAFFIITIIAFFWLLFSTLILRLLVI